MPIKYVSISQMRPVLKACNFMDIQSLSEHTNLTGV